MTSKQKNSNSCFGEPCFIVESEGSDIGVCTKTKAKIHVDLAKRKKLCNYEKPARKQLYKNTFLQRSDLTP